MRYLAFFFMLLLVLSCGKTDCPCGGNHPCPTPGPCPCPHPPPQPGLVYGPFKAVGPKMVIEGDVAVGSKFGVKEATERFKITADKVK